MPETAQQRIDQNLPTVTPDVTPAAAASRKKETTRVERVAKRFEVKDVDLYYAKLHAVQDVTMTIEANKVTSLIGSSGCGKTTMLRSLNRMHELTPGASVTGEISLDGHDIYASTVDPVEVRRLVGMVFQAPNPFPTMSVYENVAAGLTLNRRGIKKSEKDAIVERSLRSAHLWEEVKDRLDRPGSGLSGGQQQRLCIPLAIEDLIEDLKTRYTIVIVTHNMQQAARASDMTAFFNLEASGKPGRLVEMGPTEQMFTNPGKKETEDYVSGRFG